MKKIRCVICEEKRRSTSPFDYQGKTVGICRSCLIVAGTHAYQAKGYDPHDEPEESRQAPRKPVATREAEDLLKVIKRLQKAVEKA